MAIYYTETASFGDVKISGSFLHETWDGDNNNQAYYKSYYSDFTSLDLTAALYVESGIYGLIHIGNTFTESDTPLVTLPSAANNQATIIIENSIQAYNLTEKYIRVVPSGSNQFYVNGIFIPAGTEIRIHGGESLTLISRPYSPAQGVSTIWYTLASNKGKFFGTFISSGSTSSITGSFNGDGSGLTGVSATAAPAGPSNAVQFNDAGAVSGSSNFIFNKSNSEVILSGSLRVTTGSTSLVVSSSGIYFTGSATSFLSYNWIASTFVANTGTVWTNMPIATASFGHATTTSGQGTYIADLTGYTQGRLWTSVQTAAGSTAASLLVQYSLDNSAWSPFSSALTISTSTGAKDTGWFSIPAAARTFVYLRLVGYNGNGAADPAFSPPNLIIR